jgi:outer membrane receptor protein involved in Fe transport
MGDRQQVAAWVVCAPLMSVAAVMATSVDAQTAEPAPPHAGAHAVGEVVVTAPRADLVGKASTASEGVIADKEIQLTPAYRPGQVLETVPGLIVTLHSGEGKANQYLMRGYNLDHGTDLATHVDDMPINQPTHAHGQGYTDLNFMIPELADRIGYTKGPYYADVGDFGAVGSVRIGYRDAIDDQLSATGGAYGFERVFAAGSQALGEGELLEAGELQHYDGPFVNPDDARKVNAVLRYSQGGDADGVSVTGMIYHQIWTNTTDIPLRAIAEDIVPDRFGTLDPSDGGDATRASVSAEAHESLGTGELTASAFAIFNALHLYNDFTHFLIDPTHGDQEDQFETRGVLGGAVDYRESFRLAGVDSELKVGGLTRFDLLDVGRLPSEGEQPLPASETTADPPAFSDHDHVDLFAAAGYAQVTTHWTAQLRSVLGVRVDYQRGEDTDLLAALHETAGYSNGGVRAQALPQPKASLIYQPARALEFYLSAGEGFHSADLRGVNQDRSVDLGLPNTPLLARQYGEEVGMRAKVRPSLTFTIAVFNLWQQSETIIDPDVGQDTAGPPSERYGYEVNVTWQIDRWLEFYGTYSGDHTRFTEPFDDGTGHLGEYITDAPVATGSAALYLQNLGPWSGGLDVRYLGGYPLSSGPCVNSAALHDFGAPCGAAPTALGQVDAKGFAQVNLNVRYAFTTGLIGSVGVYNLLDTNAAAAEFWYVDRLKSEIAEYPQGRADVHEHPLEPRMVRVSLDWRFK